MCLTFVAPRIELTVQHKVMTILVLLVLITTFCAHKAAPLRKDRLRPRLQSVLALSNRQLQYTFSEPIDTIALHPDSLLITNNNDTLSILLLYPSLSAAEIVAITDLQQDILYKTSGVMYDTARNKGVFETSFNGTSQEDTVRPWVVQYSQGAKQTEFSVVFSEAMDTTFITFHVVPRKNLVASWQNLRACRFLPANPEDSLRYDTTYHLYMTAGAQDISNNFMKTFLTSITPDTVYQPARLRGRVYVNDTFAIKGVAVLRRERPLGISLISGGSFVFEVRDTLPYTVDVISGEYSGTASVAVREENNVILQLQEKTLDNLID